MTRLQLVVLIACGLTLSASPTVASNCAIDQYDHNGSLMEMQVCDGGGMSISYLRPRQGLVAVGVLSGTLLFDGVEHAGGAISGQARRFSKTCGPITYPVTGQNSRHHDHPSGQCTRRRRTLPDHRLPSRQIIVHASGRGRATAAIRGTGRGSAHLPTGLRPLPRSLCEQ